MGEVAEHLPDVRVDPAGAGLKSPGWARIAPSALSTKRWGPQTLVTPDPQLVRREPRAQLLTLILRIKQDNPSVSPTRAPASHVPVGRVDTPEKGCPQRSELAPQGPDKCPGQGLIPCWHQPWPWAGERTGGLGLCLPGAVDVATLRK